MREREVIAPSRREIEAKLAGVGDYVKMDYLQQCLKKQIDFETKRFVMVKLSAIYESRLMFLDAAKLIKNVADINTTFEGKYNDFAKSMELFIKAGDYDEAEGSFKKALACGNERQRAALKIRLKDVYKKRAGELLAKDKRKNAMDIYERIVALPYIDANERKESQKVLMQLYQRLGKIKEFYALQKDIDNPQPVKVAEEKPRYDNFNIDDLLR